MRGFAALLALAGAASAQNVAIPRVRAQFAAPANGAPSAGRDGSTPALAPALSVLPLSAASLPGAPESGKPAAAALPPVEIVPAGKVKPEHPTRHDGLALGLLADPAKGLGGMTFRFNEWQYLSFTVVTEDARGLGEATTNGAPGADSKLEYKHVAREFVADGKRLYRHDYGWLALGATPAGSYAVAFPDEGFGFTGLVEKLDKSTREERIASAKRIVSEVFDEKDPEPEFGPGVPEKIRAFMGPHQRLVGGMLPDYERYLREDPLLDEPGRTARLQELESLREFHREIAEGRSRYTTLSPVVAQLMARERSIVADYKRYMLDNPAVGRVSAQMHVEQIDHYREIMSTLHSVYAEAERLGEPGMIAKAAGKAVELWTRLRIWLQTRNWR